MPYRCLAVGVVMALAAPSAAAAPEPAAQEWQPVRVVAESSLQGTLSSPRDVRWVEPAKLWIADAAEGLVSVPIDTPTRSSTKLEADPEDGFHSWFRLGASSTHLAGSSFAFHVWWRGPEDGGGEYAVEYPADIDVFDDRLLVIGVRRNDAGELAAEGDIAWTGPLGDELTAVLPSRSGAGAETMQRCASLDLPRARFLSDGSFVLVPGVDSGVFLFGEDGRLVRTWESEKLGLDAGCPLSAAEEARLDTTLEARADWRAGRRLVDEILPLPEGFGLVVRSRRAGLTTWELLWLQRDGSVEVHPLPLESRSKWTHLHGDTRGRRLALLLFEAAPLKQISQPARIVMAELAERPPEKTP